MLVGNPPLPLTTFFTNNVFVLNGGVWEFTLGGNPLTNYILNSATGNNGTITSLIGSVRIAGGASGFSAFGNDVLLSIGSTISNASVVNLGGFTNNWQSGDWAPSPFILNASSASANIGFSNTIDLASALTGSTFRAIEVDATNPWVSTLYGPLINVNATSNTEQSSVAHFRKQGTGTLVLTTNEFYNGGTTVRAGTLVFAPGASATNSAGFFINDQTNVSNAAVLDVGQVGGITIGQAVPQILGGGPGTIVGAVTIASGGTLAPGDTMTSSLSNYIYSAISTGSIAYVTNRVATLTVVSNLTINSGATLLYDLGTTGGNDQVIANNGVTLVGMSTLNVRDSGGFTNGTYTLISYGGSLSGSGATLTVGTTPNASFNYAITTNGGQVNLVVSCAGCGSGDPFTQWQQFYFGTNDDTVGVPSAYGSDPLGKGISNTNQFLLGLNPINAASTFRITSVVKQGGTATITWKTSGGDVNAGSFSGPTVITNIVQGSVGNGSGGYSTNFSNISGSLIITPAGDTTTGYTDTSATNKYYRIRLGP